MTGSLKQLARQSTLVMGEQRVGPTSVSEAVEGQLSGRMKPLARSCIQIVSRHSQDVTRPGIVNSVSAALLSRPRHPAPRDRCVKFSQVANTPHSVADPTSERPDVRKRDENQRVLPATTLKRRAGLAGMGLVGLVALSGCSLAEWQRGAMPEPASDEANRSLSLWQGSWVAALAVGFLVWGLIIWAIIAFRRRRATDIPVQTQYHMPIETLWTIAPLIMIIGLFYFTARDEAVLTSKENNNQQTVDVVGFRWSWTFNYVNQDVFDTGQPAYSSQEKASGPVPADDVAVPTLWLPINQKVRFNLTSPDVIHSFWVPVFLTKLDVVPGRTNVLELTPNRLGTFAGKCAELCGVNHSRMLFNVKVVTQAEFDAHVAQLRLRGQSGQLETGRTTDQAQEV